MNTRGSINDMDTVLFAYGISLAFGLGICVASFYIVLLEAIDYFSDR